MLHKIPQHSRRPRNSAGRRVRQRVAIKHAPAENAVRRGRRIAADGRASTLSLPVPPHAALLPTSPAARLPISLPPSGEASYDKRMSDLAVFDFDAFVDAYDTERRSRGLDWFEFADELWEQSVDLNAKRPDDHCLCGGAVSRMRARGATSCQYALFMLRWLGRPPEQFLTGAVRDVGDTRLPEAGPDSRIRWDLNELYRALNEQRQGEGLTWAALAVDLDCTPSRLTNLRTARIADLALVMRVTQWVGRPAAAFIHPAQW